MKKVLASLLMLFVFMVSVPIVAEAHNSCPRHRKAKKSKVTRNYNATRYRSARYRTPYYRTAGYTTYKRPSFYRRHRNLINLGIATGGGALIGGLAGGKKVLASVH